MTDTNDGDVSSGAGRRLRGHGGRRRHGATPGRGEAGSRGSVRWPGASSADWQGLATRIPVLMALDLEQADAWRDLVDTMRRIASPTASVDPADAPTVGEALDGLEADLATTLDGVRATRSTLAAFLDRLDPVRRALLDRALRAWLADRRQAGGPQ
jgi:hypothetical protein